MRVHVRVFMCHYLYCVIVYLFSYGLYMMMQNYVQVFVFNYDQCKIAIILFRIVNICSISMDNT